MFARENAFYRGEKIAAHKLMAISLTLNYLSMRLVQIVVMLAGTVLGVRGARCCMDRRVGCRSPYPN